MWMRTAIDFLDPARGNAMIAPILGDNWWSLQHDNVITAPSRALAHTHTGIVPGDQINACQNIRNPQMVRFAQAEGIHPAHAIPRWCQHPSNLVANRVDVALRHWR